MSTDPSTTVALPNLRVSTSVSDPPAVAAAYVYSGQLSLGVRGKEAAGIQPPGKRKRSTCASGPLSEDGRAHPRNPVTPIYPIPSFSFKKKKQHPQLSTA